MHIAVGPLGIAEERATEKAMSNMSMAEALEIFTEQKGVAPENMTLIQGQLHRNYSSWHARAFLRSWRRFGWPVGITLTVQVETNAKTILAISVASIPACVSTPLCYQGTQGMVSCGWRRRLCWPMGARVAASHAECDYLHFVDPCLREGSAAGARV
jgi:hypothetical protein